MKFIRYEIRFLLYGLAFGFIFMPAILWYVHFKYDLYLFVFNADSIGSFYREIYTGLNDPRTWFGLSLPYLLLRLILLLFRTKKMHPLASTPLADAALRGREDRVRTLLTNGSDINSGNHNGKTPLHLAAEQGNHGVVKILLEQGADVDAAETGSGYTPLHYAARQGYTDLCELLIRFGADPDALTEHLDSPFHLAIEKGQAGVVGVLLKYHARLNIKNRNDQTPLEQAERLENQQIVSLIHQHLNETWPYLQIQHR